MILAHDGLILSSRRGSREHRRGVRELKGIAGNKSGEDVGDISGDLKTAPGVTCGEPDGKSNLLKWGNWAVKLFRVGLWREVGRDVQDYRVGSFVGKLMSKFVLQ